MCPGKSKAVLRIVYAQQICFTPALISLAVKFIRTGAGQMSLSAELISSGTKLIRSGTVLICFVLILISSALILISSVAEPVCTAPKLI